MLFRKIGAFAGILLLAGLSLTSHLAVAESVLEIQLGHSRPLMVGEEIVTAAFGNPTVASSVVVKPDTLLINAKNVGSTSLTLFGKSGNVREYRILVSYDLTLLRQHLMQLDKGISVQTDPNGNGIVLLGIVANKAMIASAELVATRFFAQGGSTIKSNPSSVLDSELIANPGRSNTAPSQAVESSTPERNQQYTIESTLTTGPEMRIINLLTTAEALSPPAMQLEAVLKRIDPRITVELVNDAYLLKGKVKTPAALARALGVADRFVSQAENVDIKVVSDYGGVLAGDVEEELDDGIEVIDPQLLQTISRGVGNRQTNTTGTNGRNNAGSLGQPLQNAKGNLAQNVSRGDMVLLAGGKVMSLLDVDDQPRVEIQMRIVSVDRNKTDKLGIDWRLDGDKVTIGNSTSRADQSNSNLQINFNAGFLPGTYTLTSFLKAIEANGAATMLSEPLITAVSGESSSFLVGGSIPIPTQTLASGGPTSNPVSATNVAYIQYGLKLIVRPTVLENGKLSIVLDQTISQPDYSDNKINILNVPIPGFTQKSISTVTEAIDGETWAVAGLITEEMQKSLRKVPFISNVPILGALFKSREDESARNELMITIKARRVGSDGTRYFNEPDTSMMDADAAAPVGNADLESSKIVRSTVE